MSFISSVVIAVIATYTSFTNYLADSVLALFSEPPAFIAQETKDSLAVLPLLPTTFEESTIPSILRESAAYQQAAIAGALEEGSFVDDPLEALVNIYCTFTTADSIRTTTGTGFFVHSEGVILTNAHVAQYLLLETTDVLGDAECLIRQGNPAIAKYKADLLYIPPAWVQKNAAVIDAAVPMGTGERDYALLFVTESATNSPLPARFPALQIATENLSLAAKNNTVTAAGYPATDFLRQGGTGQLLPQKATTRITELYTFGSNFADVFSIRGSIVGAEGSSGGPIVNEKGQAIGLIVTRGDDTVDGPGSLRAITLSHINRTIEEETGFTLARNVSGDISLRSNVFKETLAPFLLTLLTNELAS